MPMINVNAVIATLGAILLATIFSEKLEPAWSLYAGVVFVGGLIGSLVGHKRDTDLGVAAIVGALIGVVGVPLLMALLMLGAFLFTGS